MKKRYLALVLAGTLLLAACGDKGKVKPEEDTELIETNEVEEEEKEISNWFVDMKTVDLDGNEVDKSMFEEYDLTLINIWASWCPPCIMEVPELEKVANKYTNVGVKGLIVEHDPQTGQLLEGITDSNREAVNQIIKDSDAHYQHILVWKDLISTDFAEIEGYPYTVFVDSNGNFVGKPVAAARNEEQWSEVIEERLEMVKTQNEK